MKLRQKIVLLFLVCAANTGCGPLVNPLNSFSTSFSGTGAYSTNSTAYLYANASGAVVSSANTLQVTFSDSNLPLELFSYATVFADELVTGSCSSLGSLVATVNGAVVSTNISATGCTDQSTISVFMDTSQVYDQQGFNGWSLIDFTFTVDLAPEVTAAATGNTASDGSGTTEGSVGVFTLTGNLDNSIVVTFSKNLTSGTLTGVLTGCAATLGAPVLVGGSNSTTVAWPLGNLGGVGIGQSCTLNIAGVTDGVNNPDDPADPNLNMTFTFH